MPIHDLICMNGHEEPNVYIRLGKSLGKSLPRCPECRSPREILWRSNHVRNVTVHTRERAVVWYNEQTGSVAYPPMNDVPMPDRYAKNNYKRIEFDSLHSLDRFCKEKKLINEKANFDNSGHADEL